MWDSLEYKKVLLPNQNTFCVLRIFAPSIKKKSSWVYSGKYLSIQSDYSLQLLSLAFLLLNKFLSLWRGITSQIRTLFSPHLISPGTSQIEKPKQTDESDFPRYSPMIMLIRPASHRICYFLTAGRYVPQSLFNCKIMFLFYFSIF